jgi:hypothetical protein
LSLTLLPALSFAKSSDSWRDWQYKDSETIQKSFNVSASPEPAKKIVAKKHATIEDRRNNGAEKLD